jgi:hypothetical protein
MVRQPTAGAGSPWFRRFPLPTGAPLNRDALSGAAAAGARRSATNSDRRRPVSCVARRFPGGPASRRPGAPPRDAAMPAEPRAAMSAGTTTARLGSELSRLTLRLELRPRSRRAAPRRPWKVAVRRRRANRTGRAAPAAVRLQAVVRGRRLQPATLTAAEHGTPDSAGMVRHRTARAGSPFVATVPLAGRSAAPPRWRAGAAAAGRQLERRDQRSSAARQLCCATVPGRPRSAEVGRTTPGREDPGRAANAMHAGTATARLGSELSRLTACV